jgi:hypothetical protein
MLVVLFDVEQGHSLGRQENKMGPLEIRNKGFFLKIQRVRKTRISM